MTKPIVILDAALGADAAHHAILVDAGTIVDVLPHEVANEIPEKARAWIRARDPEILDARGALVAPGFIDLHTHFAGGGGFDGFDSRSPELQLTDFTMHGVTTAVGVPGFDTMSRGLEGLLAKAYALAQEGVTTRILVGGFDLARASLTGTIKRDCYLLPAVAGVKIALGDPSVVALSGSTLDDLLRELTWTSRALRRSLLLHVHLGPLPEGRDALLRLADEVAPGVVVMGTHMNRSPAHLEIAAELVARGGHADISGLLGPGREGGADAVDPAESVLRLADATGGLDRITVSSDANGSAPSAERPGYRRFTDSLYDTVLSLVRAELPVADALSVVSENPARALGLFPVKGLVATGSDADLVFLDDDLAITDVIAGGRLMVRSGRAVVTGRFESGERATRAGNDR